MYVCASRRIGTRYAGIPHRNAQRLNANVECRRENCLIENIYKFKSYYCGILKCKKKQSD